MKYIAIERPNGKVTLVRKEPDSPSERPLSEHEQLINIMSEQAFKRNNRIQTTLNYLKSELTEAKHPKLTKRLDYGRIGFIEKVIKKLEL